MRIVAQHYKQILEGVQIWLLFGGPNMGGQKSN